MAVTVTDRLFGENSSVAVKAPVVAASSGANLALSGLTAVGSYVPQSGDRILVKDQDDPIQNGIYNASTAAWTRTGDFDGTNDVVQGTLVVVLQGVTGIFYQLTTVAPVIGSSALTFTQVWQPPSITYPQTAAEVAAGVVPANYSYVPGTVERYGANAIPGATNMLAAVTAAFNVALNGGGDVIFGAPVDYFLGTISVSTSILLTLTGLANVQVRGNGARLVTNTTVQDADNIPVWFEVVNPTNILIENLRHYDSGADVTVDFQGPRCWSLTATGSDNCGQITYMNCSFTNIVDPNRCHYDSGTARVQGIKFIRCLYEGCYYGPTFQEQGDDVTGDIITVNVRRSYYLYGVSGHDVVLNVHHDGDAPLSATGCILIKRYSFDTRNIRIRANFHGNVPQVTVVDFEIQNGTPSITTECGITQIGAITGGSGYTNGVYSNVPLTGGSGTGATAQITVAGGAVTYVQPTSPGVGYLSSDTVSAAASSLGGAGSGFSAPVSVGGVVQDIDVDCHFSDDIEPGGSAQSLVGFTSYTNSGGVNTTTTDFWDGISIRGNFGAWNPTQTAPPIIVRSTQSRLGRLMLAESLLGAMSNEAQVYPGFVVRPDARTEVYTRAGDVTAASLSLDLQKYDGTGWALRLRIYVEADWSLSDASRSYYEYVLLGYKDYGAVPTISTTDQIISQYSGTQSVPTLAASGTGIDLALTEYKSANASTRVEVEHMKFL